MKRTILLLCLFVLLGQIICHAEGYRLRNGDELTISVREAPEFSGAYIVGEDGNIEFPEVGVISAVGMLVNEVATKIKTGLELEYLKRANVTVRVSKYTPIRFYMLGAIASPGTFEIHPGMTVTVLQAIASAGGLREDADTKNITIIRKGNGTLKVDLSAAFEKGDASNDVTLADGDILIVLKKEDLFAYVLGTNKSGGRIVFPPKVKTIPLGILMALAGGIGEVTDGEVQVFPKDALGIVIPKVFKLTEKGLSNEDMAVHISPGETVFVIDRKTKVYVLGKVNSPGAIAYREGLSISECIALAGGLSGGSAENRTRIITMNSDGTRTVKEVNLVKVLSPSDGETFNDIRVQPWTIIYVPESRI